MKKIKVVILMSMLLMFLMPLTVDAMSNQDKIFFLETEILKSTDAEVTEKLQMQLDELQEEVELEESLDEFFAIVVVFILALLFAVFIIWCEMV